MKDKPEGCSCETYPHTCHTSRPVREGMIMREWPTARRYLTPDQRLLEVVVRMRDMEWTPEPEQPEEYRQGWRDACERIIEIWSGEA